MGLNGSFPAAGGGDLGKKLLPKRIASFFSVKSLIHLVDFTERKRRFFRGCRSGGRARPHSPHDRPHSLHDRPLAPLIGPIVPLDFKGRRTLRKFRSWSAPYSRRWGREAERGERGGGKRREWKIRKSMENGGESQYFFAKYFR